MSEKPPNGPGSSRGQVPAGQPEKPGRLKQVTDFITSITGLLTVLCTVLTALAALLGALAHDQASQISQQKNRVNTQESRITAQASQIAQLKAQIDRIKTQPAQAVSPTTSPSTSAVQAVSPNTSSSKSAATAPDTSTAPPMGGQSVYLSSIDPVDKQNLTGYFVGARKLSAKEYSSSIGFDCGVSETTATYSAAGFSQFSATVGIADNAPNATSVTLSVSLTGQDGHAFGSPVTVSLGHPQTLTAAVSGEAQITVHCSGKYPANQEFPTAVTLGNALVRP